MKHPPTVEQQAVITKFSKAGDIIVKAGAGTGKTSLLRMMAEAESDYRGLYIARGKDIQLEAEATFPKTVRCRTAHSLAYGHMMNSGRRNSALMQKLDRRRYTRDSDLVRLLFGDSTPFVTIDQDGGSKTLGPTQLAHLALAVSNRYLQSESRDLKESHMVKPDGVTWDAWKRGGHEERLMDSILDAADKILDDVFDPDGEVVRFTLDVALKQWSLDSPVLRYDYIFIDEAQDISPVIAEVLFNQPKDTQLVWVGDSSQSIFQWAGAIDAMRKVEREIDGIAAFPLSESFRFGAEVARMANGITSRLEDALTLTGRGDDGIVTVAAEMTYADTDAILVRTNADAIGEALKVMEAQLMPHVVADLGGMRRFVSAAQLLQDGQKPSHDVLSGFGTWDNFTTAVGKSQELQGEFGVLVGLVEQYGCARLLQLLDKMDEVEPDEADVQISTVHKSKGLEWDSVRLGGSFGSNFRSDPELMLAYVAVTRARRRLHIGALWPVAMYSAPWDEAVVANAWFDSVDIAADSDEVEASEDQLVAVFSDKLQEKLQEGEDVDTVKVARTYLVIRQGVRTTAGIDLVLSGESTIEWVKQWEASQLG